jgi:hypothetical protein
MRVLALALALVTLPFFAAACSTGGACHSDSDCTAAGLPVCDTASGACVTRPALPVTPVTPVVPSSPFKPEHNVVPSGVDLSVPKPPPPGSEQIRRPL